VTRLVYIVVFVLASCSDSQVVLKSVRGPQGVTAHIQETAHGAAVSNQVRISLTSRDGTTAEIFSGAGGSDPDVHFIGRNFVVVQYCWPNSYKVTGYVYDLGDSGSFNNIRITAATGNTQIGSRRFCNSNEMVDIDNSVSASRGGNEADSRQ
jgi:hypothetical protein